jgi:hypothetical protein
VMHVSVARPDSCERFMDCESRSEFHFEVEMNLGVVGLGLNKQGLT